MREIATHKVNELNEAITIKVLDEPGSGGACHKYLLTVPERPSTQIDFQNGPIQEAGVNGLSNEAILAVVQDRLEGFQSGEFKSHYNERALRHVRNALDWLHKRTKDRMSRGVEGTLVKSIIALVVTLSANAVSALDFLPLSPPGVAQTALASVPRQSVPGRHYLALTPEQVARGVLECYTEDTPSVSSYSATSLPSYAAYAPAPIYTAPPAQYAPMPSYTPSYSSYGGGFFSGGGGCPGGMCGRR